MKLTTFQRIVDALHRHEVRFLLVGGMAVVAHGYGRMTYDVDLQTLIRMKREAGRPVDVEDVRHLEALAADDG
jgi:hypothetical protein